MKVRTYPYQVILDYDPDVSPNVTAWITERFPELYPELAHYEDLTKVNLQEYIQIRGVWSEETIGHWEFNFRDRHTALLFKLTLGGKLRCNAF